MKGLAAHNTTLTSANKLGLLTFSQSLPCSTYIFKSPTVPSSVGWRRISKLNMPLLTIRAQPSDVGSGSEGNEKKEVETEVYTSGRTGDSLSINGKQPDQLRYALSAASVLIGTGLIFSLIAFAKGGPSSILDVIAKSGFTAAFSLILVSEIGDKLERGTTSGTLSLNGSSTFLFSVLGELAPGHMNTFFIAALLAMQYKKGLVLLGSMAALSLMTILSVVIGRIFHSVPAQFQTTLPIGEYAAVTLLLFFGLKSIKDAWELPSQGEKRDVKSNTGLDEYAEAEELVKEKASAKNSLEIIWKSFSLVFFAEWGDRSMLATIALGAAQSPWGVASGAIGGHLVATLVAILGGAFFGNYISEKLVGYIGGTLFLVFAVATFFGVF